MWHPPWPASSPPDRPVQSERSTPRCCSITCPQRRAESSRSPEFASAGCGCRRREGAWPLLAPSPSLCSRAWSCTPPAHRACRTSSCGPALPEKGLRTVVPLVEVEVGGDDGGLPPVALLHELEEDVGLLGTMFSALAMKSSSAKPRIWRCETPGCRFHGKDSSDHCSGIPERRMR